MKRLLLHSLFFSFLAHAALADTFGPIRPTYETVREQPAVLINQLGLAQQQLSIRGGSAKDSGLLLNGLLLRNPWSGTFNADTPFSAVQQDEPSLQCGRANSTGHAAGSVALNLSPMEEQHRIYGGGGYPDQGLAGISTAHLLTDTLSAGGFIDAQQAQNIDSAGNDFERFTGGAQLQYWADDTQADLLISHQQKKFDAQGFYGAPSTVYAEEKTQDTLALASWTRGDRTEDYWRLTASARQFEDDYRLPSAAFSHEAETRQAGLTLQGQTLQIQNWSLYAQGDLHHERLSADSADQHRTYGALLLQPQLSLERVKLSAGLNTALYSTRSADFLPQAAIEGALTDNATLFASYTEQARLPYYRELTYSDPYHVNNTSLERQKTQNSELGFRHYLSATVDWQAAVFHRRQQHATDWVKTTATDTAWTATDLGTLNALGTELSLNVIPSDALRFNLHYQWMHKDEKSVHAGLYELDYPEHLLNLSASWQCTPEIQLSTVQTLRYQTTNAARTSSRFGPEGNLALHYTPRYAGHLRLSFLIDNLWDTDFQPIPGSPALKRTFTTALTIRW